MRRDMGQLKEAKSGLSRIQKIVTIHSDPIAIRDR
jgi:hypothetical protein